MKKPRNGIFVLYHKELISLIYKELLEIEKKMAKRFMNRQFTEKKKQKKNPCTYGKRLNFTQHKGQNQVKLH